MSEPRYQIVLRRVEREQVTLDQLAASAGLHPTLVECFVEFGLIEPDERAGRSMLFNVELHHASSHDRALASGSRRQPVWHRRDPRYA